MIELGEVRRIVLAGTLAALTLAAQTMFGAQLGPAPVLSAPPKEGQIPSSGEITRLATNNWSRDAVINYYNSEYVTSNGVVSGWSGDVPSCTAGDISTGYRAATTRRVNYYRGMCGLPAVDNIDGVQNSGDQESALIMSRNNNLSHYPDSSWYCYSVAGAAASSKSNIALGAAGPGAIDLYMQDSGTDNYFCGHRRWILFPPQTTMGNGSVTPTSTYYPANALWSTGPFGSRPSAPEYIAWPPPGYVPIDFIFARWSFSVNRQVEHNPDHVNFTGASVSMTRNGVPLSLAVNALLPTFNSGSFYGDHTIVWEPSGLNPAEGVRYGVTINNVVIDGVARSFYYEVYAVNVAQASSEGAPTMLGWSDNGGGVLAMAWANSKLTPAQFLGFAYDIYTASYLNGGVGGSMWYQYSNQAFSGFLSAFYSGGYHVWNSNQYSNGHWFASNAISNIEYSGTPHTPINVSATNPSGHVARLNFKPDIYGTWIYWIIVNNGSGWVTVNGPSGNAQWQAVTYGSTAFTNGRVDLTMPAAGNYTIYIQARGWVSPYPYSAAGSAFVHVN